MRIQDEQKLQLRNNYRIQWIATIGVFLLMLQIGFYIGWSSPNVTRLLSKDSLIHMTDEEVSWLVSLMAIGGAIGAIVGSISVEYMGTRKTILLTYGLMSISWICLIAADSANWLYAGRLIGALPTTMVYCCFSMFIAEISDPKIRGTLISTAVAGTPLGTAISTVMETYVSMKITSSIYLTANLIGIALFLWLRDSPYYAARKGYVESIEKSIKFYKPNCSLEKESKDVKDFIESENCQTFVDKITELNNPVMRRSMLLIIILFGGPYATGMVCLLSYMEKILTDGGFHLVEPKMCVIYVNIICVFSASLSVNLIDKFGRRFLYVCSSVGTTIAMASLGLHFYLISHGFDSETMQWLPISATIFYVTTYSIGFNTVPSTVLSEIFTENMKSLAVCIATLSMSLFGFIATKMYQPIIDSFGQTYAFWTFAVIDVIGLIAALSLLMETKGKTFQQIQDKLINK